MAVGDPGNITFSTQTVGGGALGASGASPNVSVQGANTGAVGPVGSGASWFDAAGGMTAPDSNLPEFITQLAEPALARQRQARMWDGFVAARGGASLEEIHEEQPWYSKLFGPTNYEIGAQTYTVLESVSNMENDLLTRMPELRKLPPEAMAEEFNRMTQSQMTGNIFADSLMTKNFMERAGPLMDLHTKERVAWQQTELLRAQYASNSANSTSFNEMSRQTSMLGNQRPAEPGEADKLFQSQMSLIDGLQPSMYQNDDSYRASVRSFVRGAVDRGEFFTTRFLEQKGILSALGPEDELDLISYIEQGEAQYRQKYIDENPEVASRMALAALYAAEGVGAEPTERMIDELNTAYEAKTGITGTPLYSGASRASMMAQSAGAHLAAQEAAMRKREARDTLAQTDADKRAAEAEDIAAGQASWDHGTIAMTINLPGLSTAKPAIEANIVQRWNESRERSPRVALGQLVQNASTGRGYVLEGVKEQYQTRARDVLREQPSDAAQSLYNEWLALKTTTAQRLGTDGKPVEGTLTGVATAALYFGDEVNTMFNRIQSNMVNGNFELAYEIARGEITTKDPFEFSAGSRQESEQQQARVADTLQTTYPKYMGYFGNQLGTSGRQAAARAIVRVVQESGGTLNTSEEGITAALQQAKLKYGTEAAGKYFWENGRDDEGRVIPSVGDWLGFSDHKETGPAIESVIDTQLRAHNIEPSPDLTANVFRMRDMENGTPVLYVHVMGAGNSGFQVITIRGDDIKVEAERIKAEQRKRPVPFGVQTLPDGSVIPRSGSAGRNY